VSQPVFMKTIH